MDRLVDLTQVPGVQSHTALELFTELGPDFVECFPPPNVLLPGWACVRTTASPAEESSRPKRARSKGDFPRWKARLATAKAITATAHKLARVIWHMIKFNKPYDPTVWAAAEEN